MREELSQLDKAREMNKQVLPKRFYKEVSVVEAEDGFEVHLDGKPTKTPRGKSLTLPSKELAEIIAGEWDAQEKEINLSLMPAIKMVNSAIEVVRAQPSLVLKDLQYFIGHDLICYRAEGPEALVERQNALWNPVVEAINAKLGVELKVTSGIISVPQPEEAGEALATRAKPLNAYELTALHNMATLLSSISLALLTFEGDITPEAAWDAAHVDEDHNISLWGEDYEAAQKRKRRWNEFLTCVSLAKAAKGA